MALDKLYLGNVVGSSGDVKNAKNWAGHSIVNSGLRWIESPTTTGEWYVELIGGGDPGILEPDFVQELTANVFTDMTRGTVTTLTAGQWDFVDGDTLGFVTIYAVPADDVDPDTLALNTLQYRIPLRTGDAVRVSSGAGPMDTNVDLSDLTLGDWIEEDGHLSAMGSNANPIRISVTRFDFAGKGAANYDLLASAISPVIRNTQDIDAPEFGLRLRGTALVFVDIRAGSVLIDDESVITRIECDARARVRVPQGAGLTTYDNRGTSVIEVGVTNLTNDSGSTTTEGSGAVTNIKCRGGVIFSNSSGLVGDAKAENEGVVDFRQSSTPRTCTDRERSGNGRIRYDPNVLTRTNDVTGDGPMEEGPIS